MQDRIRVKKIMKAVVQKANQIKDLDVDVLIRQAEAQVKRLYQKSKNRWKNRDKQ